MLPDRNEWEDAALLDGEVELEKPRLYNVLLHNDDYTTRDFVVLVLESVFHQPSAKAVEIMLNVHKLGVGIAGTYTREIADTKVRIVTEAARAQEFPLLCTMEEA